MVTRRRPRIVAGLIGACALVAGCADDDESATSGPIATGAVPETSASASPVSVVEPTAPASSAATDVGATSPAVCAERDGATVTDLPDVYVPAVEVAEVWTPAVEISGETVPGVTIEGVAVRPQTVDAGCIIEYDAPGGCLGAVEISAAVIPAATIPRSVIPAVALPDGETVAEVVIGAVSVPQVVAPAVRTEAVCQIAEDGDLPTVSRAGVVRRAISRDGVARPGATRPERCVGEACVPAVRVEAVRLEPVVLPDVDVAPARLQRRQLRQGVDVIEGADEASSYVAPSDVLFDTDQAVIRADADAALTELSALIVAADPAAPIRIEGHTDDRADEEYNLALSQRRAQAVADWLVARAGVDVGRVTVTGLGETTPAYPNDNDEHRQLNRRVVITVG